MTNRCFIFGEFSGLHKSWTLAVMAVSVSDAREYVKSHHKSGKLLQSPQPGEHIDASCGATTEKASTVIREQLEREWQEYQAMKAIGEIE